VTLVDAHVHLASYPTGGSPLRTALGTSLCLLSCTVNAGEAAENARIRDRTGGAAKSFVGIHPSDATAQLPRELLAPYLEGCDGIGEIGLDEKYSTTEAGGNQMRAFVDQLALAESLGKPVQVHSRGSERKCLDALSAFNLNGVLMHWFEGEALLSEVVSRGYFVSVGPALLYSRKIRRIAEATPMDRLLTESDGPVGFGPLGGAAGPGLIPSVLLGLADVHGVRYDDMESRVESNARALLRVERLI
jgi:TatD DNase family protein